MLRASDTDSIWKLLYGIIQKAPKIDSVTNEAISCPACQSSKGILWLGTNPHGVARCRCIACQKNFCHHPSRLIAESNRQTAPAAPPRFSQSSLANLPPRVPYKLSAHTASSKRSIEL